MELSHYLSTYEFIGSFSASGTSGGVAFLASAEFAAKYPHRTPVEVVRGRLAILRCTGPAAPPIDLISVHLVDIPRLLAAAQLARLAQRLQPLDHSTTFMLGDFNFLTPGEGRLDVTTGTHSFDDSPAARSFHELFPSYAELRAEGYSRRQFRDGRLQLLSRLDKAYTNMMTHDLMKCNPSCAYIVSLADPRLESDHSPLHLVFARPCAKGPFRMPRWVPAHLAYQASVEEHRELLTPLGDDPFGELRQVTMALQHAANRVLRLPASLHAETRPSWLCHWLFVGRSAWHRRDGNLVRKVVARLPDYADFFVMDGELLRIFPEERFSELVGGLMHTILLAGLSDDVHRSGGDEKAQALRALPSQACILVTKAADHPDGDGSRR